MTIATAYNILEIDSLIAWLIKQDNGTDFLVTQIEELKQQKLLIYDNCNRL